MRGLSHEIALSVLFTYTEIWLFIICWIVFKLPCLHAFLNSSTRRRLEFKIINTILTQTTHLCMLTYLPWSRYWSYTYSFNSRLKLNSGTMWSKDIYVKLNSPFFLFTIVHFNLKLRKYPLLLKPGGIIVLYLCAQLAVLCTYNRLLILIYRVSHETWQ